MDGERKERCETCRFWLGYEQNEEGADLNIINVGHCQRYPPSLGLHALEMMRQGRIDRVGPLERYAFPHTENDDWCGEWRAKDESVKTDPMVSLAEFERLASQLDPEVIREKVEDIDKQRDALMRLLRMANSRVASSRKND